MPDTASIDRHMEALRALGCAVVVITSEDVHSCMDPEESGITEDQARDWLERHRSEVEEVILGEYWGDSIRDLIVFHEGRELTSA